MASRVVSSASRLCVGRNLVRGNLTWRAAFQRRFVSSRLPSRFPSHCERWGREWSGRRYVYCRLYSTSGSGEGGEGEEEGSEEEEGSGGLGGDEVQSMTRQQYTLALAPVAIPDIFPEVPVLPISRHPIFPKYVKMLEVRIVCQFCQICCQ